MSINVFPLLPQWNRLIARAYIRGYDMNDDQL